MRSWNSPSWKNCSSWNPPELDDELEEPDDEEDPLDDELDDEDELEEDELDEDELEDGELDDEAPEEDEAPPLPAPEVDELLVGSVGDAPQAAVRLAAASTVPCDRRSRNARRS